MATEAKGQLQQHGAAHERTLCVCYVLCYRAPDYVRTRSLLAALGMIPGLRVVTAVNRHRGVWRYLDTWRALLRARTDHDPDVYILGFRGHEVFPWVRWITRGKPLVFDALMSPTAALSEERKAGWVGTLLAQLTRPVERFALAHSQIVLTDTKLHSSYLSATFGLSDDRFLDVPVGAVEVAPPVSAVPPEREFSVLFYGSFLALHGIDVIVSAAAQLNDLPIRFDFVGGSRTSARRLHRRCARLGVTNYTYRRWVPFDRLVCDVLQRATVCLGGPFGDTPQAQHVITGKTSQSLALGKPAVIGKVSEDCGFEDRVNCLLVDQGDPDALSGALRWAYDHRSELVRIGNRGRELYEARLSVRVIADRLSGMLRALAPTWLAGPQ